LNKSCSTEGDCFPPEADAALRFVRNDLTGHLSSVIHPISIQLFNFSTIQQKNTFPVSRKCTGHRSSVIRPKNDCPI